MISTEVMKSQDVEVLKRLCQIASEIRFALQRGKTEIALQAAALLTPTLELWQDTTPVNETEREMRANIAAEIQILLEDSEQRLTEKMREIGARKGTLTRGKRTLAVVRSHHPKSSGQTIDSMQ